MTWRLVAAAGGLALAFARPVSAQAHGLAGGALVSTTERPAVHRGAGGTVEGVSLLIGAVVTPRLSIEFEPSFPREFKGAGYVYRPGPSYEVRVVPTRRDGFYAFQLRIKAGVLEPVAGVTLIHGETRRLATYVTDGRVYFDQRRSDDVVGVLGGLDAALRVASHVAVVPSLRMIVRPSSSSGFDRRVDVSSLILRFGVGAHVTF